MNKKFLSIFINITDKVIPIKMKNKKLHDY